MTRRYEHDVVDLLLAQHDGIRALMHQVPTSDGDRKREAFEELARLLMVHESAEEQVLHPIARRQVGDAVVAARLLEERHIKALLADLYRNGTGQHDFDRRFAALEAAFRDHAERAEQAEFPALRRTMDPARLRKMAHAVRAAETVAPTHPRPPAGIQAVGTLVAAPPATLVDRARNAVQRWQRQR